MRYVAIDHAGRAYIVCVIRYWLLNRVGSLFLMIRPASGPVCLLSFSCWSILVEHARTLNQYMYVSTARTTAHNRINASVPLHIIGSTPAYQRTQSDQRQRTSAYNRINASVPAHTIGSTPAYQRIQSDQRQGCKSGKVISTLPGLAQLHLFRSSPHAFRSAIKILPRIKDS